MKKSRFADPAVHDELVEREKKKLLSKRHAKHATKIERRRDAPPLAGTSLESIAIEVLDPGPFVHHGASPDDLRAILSSLPAQATEGIPRIQLRLGKAAMEEREMVPGALLDPHSGRVSMEVFPGVYCAPILGTRFHTGLIAINAFVYETERLPLPERICTLYLRLKSLTTLVHEVAHHHDAQCRVARGRWVADRLETVESYAEKMEHEWTQEIVIPHLEKTYPRDVEFLARWTRRIGGIPIDLKMLAGDPRQTRRSGPQPLCFSFSCAFEIWIEDLAECKHLWESRLALAWQAYFANMYEVCLRILDTIGPDDALRTGVLSCKGHTLACLGNYPEALAIAEAIHSGGACTESCALRSHVFKAQKRWLEVLSNCREWEQIANLEKCDLQSALRDQAIAYCALRQEAEMEAAIERYLTNLSVSRHTITPEKVQQFRGRIFRQAGRS